MGVQWSCLKAQDFTEKHLFHMKEALYIYTQVRTAAAVLISPMVIISAGSARNILSEKVKKLKSTFTSRGLTVYFLKMCLLQKSSFN